MVETMNAILHVGEIRENIQSIVGTGYGRTMNAILLVGEILAAIACFYLWYFFLKRTHIDS